MLLLKAIPKEWDTVVQMYCNSMQMANVTFDGVQDAIMAEFERTARPACYEQYVSSFLLTCVCLMPSIFTYLNTSLPAGTHKLLNTC
jgi:hypothetical protein